VTFTPSPFGRELGREGLLILLPPSGTAVEKRDRYSLSLWEYPISGAYQGLGRGAFNQSNSEIILTREK
jgi:hypothetical protein